MLLNEMEYSWKEGDCSSSSIGETVGLLKEDFFFKGSSLILIQI